MPLKLCLIYLNKEPEWVRYFLLKIRRRIQETNHAKHRRTTPTAKEILKQSAFEQAEKAEQYAKQLAAADAEKRALTEELTKPSGLSVIQRAEARGGLLRSMKALIEDQAVAAAKPT